MSFRERKRREKRGEVCSAVRSEEREGGNTNLRLELESEEIKGGKWGLGGFELRKSRQRRGKVRFRQPFGLVVVVGRYQAMREWEEVVDDKEFVSPSVQSTLWRSPFNLCKAKVTFFGRITQRMCMWLFGVLFRDMFG